MARKKKETLGARLRAVRLAAGLSQTALAERSGIPKPTLSRYENDHVLPSITTLGRIAQCLNVALVEIVNSSERGGALIARAFRKRGIEIRSVSDAEDIADWVEDFYEMGVKRRSERS